MDRLLFLILLNTIDFYVIPFHFLLDLKWLYIDFAYHLVSSTLLCCFFHAVFVAYLSVVYVHKPQRCKFIFSSVTLISFL